MVKAIRTEEVNVLDKMLPSAEQLEFTFDFQEGERVAPVSALYKSLINTAMEEAMEFAEIVDARVHGVAVILLKSMIKNDAVFLKTNKKFQKEVHGLLDMPFESLYKAMRGHDYVPNEEITSSEDVRRNILKKNNIAVNKDINTNIKDNVKLTLVK